MSDEESYLGMKYLPLAILFILVVAILLMSHYAETRKYEHLHNAGNVNGVPLTADETQKSTQKTGESEHPPSWIETFAWPEGATAWALLLTLFVIAWQSAETRDAAQASRASIRLQEAGMRQWVDVEARAATVEERSYMQDAPDFVVDLSFYAVNNTAYALTITAIETIVEMVGESEVFPLETNVTLPPRRESESNRYAFYIPTRSIKRESLDGGTIVTINGSVTFIDCLEVTRSDYFGGFYRLRGHVGAIDFMKMKALGIVPDRTVETTRLPKMSGKDAAGKRWPRRQRISRDENQGPKNPN